MKTFGKKFMFQTHSHNYSKPLTGKFSSVSSVLTYFSYKRKPNK